ncbi:MAG: GntR family transcriptional regulator, partial [Pseudomonadota bacterium]
MSDAQSVQQPGNDARQNGVETPPEKVHEQVYRELRGRLMSGQVVPGRGITLRKLAGELGVSPMPVRDAVSRLVAERALTIGPNRRILVPEMTAGRFQEIVTARTALEPAAARRAFPNIDRKVFQAMREADDQLEHALAAGDVEDYISSNHRFHFTLYGAAFSSVLVPLIESLWLQFSPFMRVAYGLVGTKVLVDYHQQALEGAELKPQALDQRNENTRKSGAIKCEV